MSPASRPKRRYSSRASRRLASRCGCLRNSNAPISAPLSAPVRICAGAAQFELAVARVAVVARDEQRPDQRLDLGAERRLLAGGRVGGSGLPQRGERASRSAQLGLAAIAPRHGRAGRHVAEAHATGLPAHGLRPAVEDAVGRADRVCAMDAAEECVRSARASASRGASTLQVGRAGRRRRCCRRSRAAMGSRHAEPRRSSGRP